MACVSPFKLPTFLFHTSKTKNMDLFFQPTIQCSPRSQRKPSFAVVYSVHVNGAGSAHSGINGSEPRVNGSARINGCYGLRVAFQGAPGAYSEFAAKTALPGCETVPCRSFADAIATIESGQADRAVLPVESTMEGTALRNYDLLLRHDVRIVQEISLFVHYCLLAMPGVRKTELRRVISHPMALAHCGRALAELGLDGEPVDDTAGAVQILRSRQLLDTAAIASPRAAVIYGLDVLAHGLQDESWNVTRFLLLAKPSSISVPQPVHSKPKTSMVIAHRGGSMAMVLKVLSAFSKRGVNLTKMEVINAAAVAPAVKSSPAANAVMILDTRSGLGKPLMRAFPHVLYVDCEGSIEDDRVKEAVEEISASSVFVRVLGCYAADTNVYDLQDHGF